MVVPNSSGETFARIELDPFSYDAVARELAAVPDPLVRAVLWATVLDGVPAAAHLELLARQLPRESSPTLVAAALGRTLNDLVRRALPPSEVPAALAVVATACALGGEPDEQRAIALARGLAWSTSDTALLRRWLDADATDQGLALDPELRWAVVRRLAELGGLAEDPDISVRRFRALAAGLWSLSRRELVTPYVAAYVAAAPSLARRGSAFAAEVGRSFPAFPLTAEELNLVRAALHGDVPAVLRRHWEDELHDRMGA